jgi:hypothetical protein
MVVFVILKISPDPSFPKRGRGMKIKRVCHPEPRPELVSWVVSGSDMIWSGMRF